jgi:hypothetical protein
MQARRALARIGMVCLGQTGMADRWAREWVRKGRQEKVAEIE